MRRALLLLALLLVPVGAGATAAIQMRAPSAQDAARSAAEATPPLPAWLEHDYQALKVCRTHIGFADRIGHPTQWSEDLPAAGDVEAWPAPRGPPDERPWLFKWFGNRSAQKAVREYKHAPGSAGTGVTCTPLTLYTPFCREAIVWSGGTGTFTEPTLPGGTGACAGGALVSTFTPVSVSTLSALHTQLGLGCKNIVLTSGITLGAVAGGATDCEVTIPSTSSIAFWSPSAFGSGTGSTGHGHSNRLRIQGPGKLGGMQMLGNTSGPNTDLIVDGVQFAPSVRTDGEVPTINTSGDTPTRVLFMNSVLRAKAAPSAQGNVFLWDSAVDLGVFNNSTAIDPGSGGNNSWNSRCVACTRIVYADNMMHKYATQQAVWRHGTGTNTGSILYHNIFVSEDGLIAKDEDSPYTNTETYGDLNTFIISGSLSNFLGRQDQVGSGGNVSGVILTNTDWRATSSGNVSASTLTGLESTPKNIHLTSGNSYAYNATFSSLVPAWPGRTSPLTGTTLDGDPSHL